jgi:hypothetical protein
MLKRVLTRRANRPIKRGSTRGQQMAITYKGASIERERDGSYSLYFAGNAYATRCGFKSESEAKAHLDRVT